jgi:hypothetical protein
VVGYSSSVSERDNLPAWTGRRGWHEAWFLTLSDPARRAGYWIRSTIRVPISGPPEPRVWFASFSLDDPPATFGVNRGYPPGALHLGSAGFDVRIGEAVLGSGRAVGEIDGGGHHVRWDLTYPTGAPTFRILPDLMYRTPVAPTRPLTPNPDVVCSGTIEIDGDRREIAELAGQQGHLFGSRHAERWAWVHCNGFDDGTVFQALSAQGRRGPFLTPYLSSAGLRLGGQWIRLGRVARRRQWGLGWWRLTLAGRRHRLEAEVSAPPENMVQARYLDPDDSPRWCHNSEVATCRLTVWERRAGGWQNVADLEALGTTHAEWAGRTPAPGVTTLHAEVP